MNDSCDPDRRPVRMTFERWAELNDQNDALLMDARKADHRANIEAYEGRRLSLARIRERMFLGRKPAGEQ